MSEHLPPIDEQELNAYVDGTLPDARREAITKRLESDAVLRARVEDYRLLNSMLRDRYDPVLDEPIPARLQIKQKQKGFAAANWNRYGAMAAMLVLGAGIGMGVDMAFRSSPTGDLASTQHISVADSSDSFARDSAIAHVMYVPEDPHPYEINADREQTMARFLAAKLGTVEHPPVLTHAGFELMGGRLFPGNSGRIVQYTYQGATGARVTLCISSPKTGVQVQANGFQLYRDGPVNVLHWIDGRLRYAVSGGVDQAQLVELAREVQTQLAVSPEASDARTISVD
jgi:anti-sigma factor RsiW